jgi:hypothetical protein
LLQTPKRPHEKALLKIICFLKGTPDEGLIRTLQEAQGLQCYIDAALLAVGAKRPLKIL